MRTVLSLTMALMLFGVARGDDAMNRETLVAMGLGEMEILSDVEALAIRGHGFNPGDKLGGYESFQQNKQAFRARGAEFHHKLASHTFAGAANFGKSKVAFQVRVQNFQGKNH